MWFMAVGKSARESSTASGRRSGLARRYGQACACVRRRRVRAAPPRAPRGPCRGRGAPWPRARRCSRAKPTVVASRSYSAHPGQCRFERSDLVKMPSTGIKNLFRRELLIQHVLALAAVGATFVLVGVLQSTVVELPSVILLYLVPIVLAASRWGRGPAITAALASILGHDLLFIEPRGTFNVARADEALGLVLLLFTALATAQLADAARRGAETAREAVVARRSDELKTALLRAVTH